MDGVRIEVRGFKELADNLNTISKEMGKKAIRRALNKAAKYLQEKIKEKTPEITGNLKEGIEVGAIEDRGAFTGSVVFSHKRKAFHAHLVEFGHRKFIHGKDTGERVPPHPYFRPAVDENEAAVAKIVEDEMRAALDRAVKKLKVTRR